MRASCAWSCLTPRAETVGIGRGHPHERRELLDELARRRPAARGSRPGDRSSVREQDECAVHPQLETPLPIAHPGLLLEQAAQRPFGRTGAHAELTQRHGAGEVMLDDARRPAQSRISGLGQMQRLLRRRHRLVDDDMTQMVQCAGAAGAVGRHREQRLPRKRRGDENGRSGGQECCEFVVQVHDAHVGATVRTMAMLGAGGHPGHARGGRDPGSVVGEQGEHTGGGMHQMSERMSMTRRCLGVREPVGALQGRVVSASKSTRCRSTIRDWRVFDIRLQCTCFLTHGADAGLEA